MLKHLENNGTKEIGLVTPTRGLIQANNYTHVGHVTYGPFP